MLNDANALTEVGTPAGGGEDNAGWHLPPAAAGPTPPAPDDDGRSGVAGTLLLAGAEVRPGERVLLIGTEGGTLPGAVRRRWPTAPLTIAEPNVAALWRAYRQLGGDAPRGVGVASRDRVTVAPDLFQAVAPPGSVEVVLLVTPPERRLTRRWLVMARAALARGGRLYLAGANNAGIKSALADAADLFTVTPLALRQRHRLAVATVPAPAPAALPAPAWASEPGIAPGTWEEMSVAARGEPLTLRSLPGVFSHGRLDPGTALLLDSMRVPAGARVLDAGCGTGVLGLVARRLGAGPVDLVDVNLLAVLAARANVADAGLAAVRVLGSDILAAVRGETYDLILSNPPFHTGKAVDDRFARAFVPQAAAALAPGGEVQMVTNRFIRYDQALGEAVGPVTVLAETGHYRVLRAVRR